MSTQVVISRVAVSKKGTTVTAMNPKFAYSPDCNCRTCQDIRRLHAGHATPSGHCALCQQVS